MKVNIIFYFFNILILFYKAKNLNITYIKNNLSFNVHDSWDTVDKEIMNSSVKRGGKKIKLFEKKNLATNENICKFCENKDNKENKNDENFQGRLNILKNKIEDYIDIKNNQNIGFKNNNSEENLNNNNKNVNINEKLLRDNNNNYHILNDLLLEFSNIYNVDNSIFKQIMNETNSNYFEFNKILKETISENINLKFYKSKYL